ncbi:hypothetical protein ACSQ67_022847 [Phaseolus vulgaris]
MVVYTFGATLMVILSFSLYNMVKFQQHTLVAAVLNPTNQVLMFKSMLEVSLIGLSEDGSAPFANQKISDACALIQNSVAKLVERWGYQVFELRAQTYEAHFGESCEQAHGVNNSDCGAGEGVAAERDKKRIKKLSPGWGRGERQGIEDAFGMVDLQQKEDKSQSR